VAIKSVAYKGVTKQKSVAIKSVGINNQAEIIIEINPNRKSYGNNIQVLVLNSPILAITGNEEREMRK
jgi:hypothetical protein